MKTTLSSLAIGGAMLSLLAAPAMASEPYQSTCAAQQFAGAYVGGHLGYTEHRTEWTDIDYYWSGDTLTRDSSGLSGGVYAGYNKASCNTLFGIEADFTLASVDGQDQYTFERNQNGEQYIDLRSKLNWYSTIRGRAGLALDNTLLYLTAGLAIADTDHRWDGFDETDAVWKFDDTKWGWVVGAGVEVAHSDRWSWRAEALLLEFGESEKPFVRERRGEIYRMRNADRFVTFRVGATYNFGSRDQPEEASYK